MYLPRTTPTVAQAKKLLKKWGATSKCRKLTEDPESWYCHVEITVCGITFKNYGIGETLKEARSIALYELACHAF